MLGAGVDLQLLDDLAGQLVVREHALDGQLDGVIVGRTVAEVRAQMDELAFNPDPDLSTEEYRALTDFLIYVGNVNTQNWPPNDAG